MADDKKPVPADADDGNSQESDAPKAAQKTQEAGAQDLLSMWGSKGPKPEEAARITRSESLPKPKPETAPHIKTEKEKKKEQAIEGEVVEQMVEKKEELIKPVDENELEFDEAEDSVGSQIEDFLRDLNLSPRHIFYFIGVIILIVALIFGGINGYKYFKNRSTQPVEQPKPPTEISSEQTGVGSAEQVGKMAEITTAMVGATGIFATVSIGREEVTETEFAEYVLTFRQLQNAYAVNLNELLNKSINRRQTLENHLAVLRNLYNEGKDKNDRIKNEAAIIQTQYNELQIKQDADDKQFFEQMNAMNPQATQDSLNDFILVSREMTALKARFKALQKLQSFYESGLNKFNLRIRDIELNAEPLISGVKVYDVSGSDLKLIVPVAIEGQQSEKLNSGNDVQFLPIGVSDIKTSGGVDYITQPIGGYKK